MPVFPCAQLIFDNIINLITDSFHDGRRPSVVRSFVRATIPLSLTDVHADLTNTSKIVAKVMIRQALIDGVDQGKFNQ